MPLTGAVLAETKTKFLEALVARPVDILTSVWIIDRIPLLFNNDIELYATWRCRLAKGLGVDPSSLITTGSSVFGTSLNPNKNFRLFTDQSDIDIAVVSDFHFSSAWRKLRNLGSDYFKHDAKVKKAINSHKINYIYSGTIATDKILSILPFSKEWRTALDDIQSTAPTNGRSVKVRIYRDLDSLREYHVGNLVSLRDKQLEEGV